MKYIYQFGIIAGVSFIGELLNRVFPLPIPASVYGLVIMLILLLTKVIKLGQVEDTAKYFLIIMPFLFVEPTVKLMTSFDFIKGQVVPLVIVCVLSTVAVLGVTGMVSQTMLRFGRKRVHRKHVMKDKRNEDE